MELLASRVVLTRLLPTASPQQPWGSCATYATSSRSSFCPGKPKKKDYRVGSVPLQAARNPITAIGPFWAYPVRALGSLSSCLGAVVLLGFLCWAWAGVGVVLLHKTTQPRGQEEALDGGSTLAAGTLVSFRSAVNPSLIPFLVFF